MSNLTIKQAQKLLKDFTKSKNWDEQSLCVDAVFLAEETGEVAKEVLTLEIPRKEKKSRERTIKDLSEELSDVFYWVMKIANRLDIDLEQAFIAKFDKIKKRK